jgi:hypothetical protein
MAQSFFKDTDETLDYVFDFLAYTHGIGLTDYLEADETIESVSLTIAPDDDELTADSTEITGGDTTVTVWLSGGRAWVVYRVTAEIETSKNRVVQEYFSIRITD